MTEQVQQQMIPAGYKQTEVGVIPEDWGCLTIGDLASVSSGGTPNRKNPDYWDGNIPWVTTALINGKEIWQANETITQQGLENSATKWCEPGTILMAMYGQGKTRGKVGVLQINATINQACAAIAVKGNTSSEFLLHFLNSQYEAIRDLSNSGGQENLSGTIIKNINIPVPQPEEQTAIANALSDTDALLSELEKLIAKKQAIKTATMQQLLTGKTRLPAFSLCKDGMQKSMKGSALGNIPADWLLVKISELVTNIIDYRGRTPRKLGMGWGNGSIVALSAGNVKKGYIDLNEECYLGSDSLYKRWMTNGDVAKDDIVFTMEAPVGNVALIPDSEKYIMSQRVILLKIDIDRYDPKYIFHNFMAEYFQSLLKEKSTGSTAQGVKRSTLELLQIPIPVDKQEQTAIANILSDMDSEIAALQQRLEKTRQLKQGMMQQLLTGKIRLIKPAASDT